MNIEKWFEDGTNLQIKELRYLRPPKLPYFLYVNETYIKGADLLNNIIENNITIERYSETNNEKDLEEIEKVDELLNKSSYTFSRQTDWLNEESMYGTFWVLDPILEKIRKKENFENGKKN